jgi:tetratricopeptide (TPR) repeat protein
MAASGTLADLLEREMRRRGWTLAYFADLLGRLGGPTVRPSVQVVWNWRSGRVPPGPTYRRLIARALDLPVEAIVNAIALQQAIKAEEDSDVDRREFMRDIVVAGAGTAAGAGLWERLIDGVNRLSVDPLTVSALQSAAAGFHRIEVQVSGVKLHRALIDHLGQLNASLSGPMPSDLRPRLISIVGESAALAGWVSWDLGDVQQASGLYRAAQHAAREAEAPGLVACVAEYRSCAAAGLGDRHAAIKELEQGRGALEGTELPRTRSWLMSRLAEEHAALGETDTAIRLIEEALETRDTAGDASEGAWVDFIDDARMAGYALSTYAQAERLDEAEDAAGWLLRSLREDTPKRRAITYADLAGMYIRRGDFDQATQFVQQSVELCVSSAPRMASDRLHALRPLLTRWNDSPEARQLGDILRAV